MKTAILTAVSGTIVAGDGDNSVTVTGFYDPISIDVEDMGAGDVLNVLQLNGAGTGYIPFCNNGRQVQVRRNAHRVTLVDPGTYALDGVVSAEITAYKIEEG